jgi:protein involved in polysaccharide export with SLBB domain
MQRSLILVLSVALLTTLGHSGFAETQTTTDEKSEERLQSRFDRERPLSLEGPIDPETYILGPLDEMLLILRGPNSKTQEILVLPEGNVILPNVGAFPAAGLTLSEFRAQVRKALAKYYRNVEIDCQLSRPRVFVVFVLGEVKEPQPVELLPPFRVSHAIRAAGGVKESGSRRLIQIREAGQTLRTVDLFLFFEMGDFDQNPMLKEGQSVYVPPKQMRVQVIGEVRLPDIYELVPGETVADVVHYAGGVNSRGDRDEILLEGTLSGEHTVLTLETADQFEPKDLDVIVVRDEFSFEKYDPVEVTGGGGRTGAIQIHRAEPLSDFLSRLWRFQPGFDIQTGILERQYGDSIRYIEFGVREVLAGDSLGDVLVEPADIISFHLRDTQVFVVGEVFQPNAVPFLPGYPAERYISLAGGPTNAGTIDRLNIYGTDGSKRSGNRNSTIYRGETIEVRQKKSRTFGRMWVGLTSLTGLVLAIVALTNTN